MTNDYISRQAAIDALMEKYKKLRNINWYDKPYAEAECRGIDEALSIISNLPSAQLETAKRIVGKSRDGMTLWYQCDMCNEPVDAQDNFCRGCGRRLIDE